MTITHVKFFGEGAHGRLLAFCVITIDDMFVVRDLKIIRGDNGIIVSMPQRKVHDHCPHCNCKNHCEAQFCNGCGKRLRSAKAISEGPRRDLYADIAHPINATGREMIQAAVVREYERWAATN